MPLDTSNHPEPFGNRDASNRHTENQPSGSTLRVDKATSGRTASQSMQRNESLSARQPVVSPTGHLSSAATPDAEQWLALQKKILTQQKKFSASKVFGDPIRGGAVYRWGVAVAMDSACHHDTRCLSRLACDLPLSRKDARAFDLDSAVDRAMDRFDGGQFRPVDCAEAVTWAAAMPHLIDRIDADRWWQLLTSLQEYRNGASLRNSASPEYLIACGELGITLAWRLSALPSCRRLQKSSYESITRWFDNEEDSIAQSISSATQTRLVLASVCRYRMLAAATSRRKFKRQQKRVAADLATWAASQTRRNGTSIFSMLSAADVKDDLGEHGLLETATALDPESLTGAIQGVLGRSQTKGRLKWEVSLPESMLHDDDAHLACLLPAWDVGRARTFIDYSQEQTRIEVHAGKTIVLSGPIETMIRVEGQEQEPSGNWVATCEYTDDDVHFLELEQPWTGGIIVQRQFLVIRDDRCLLLADCVLPSLGHTSAPHQERASFSERLSDGATGPINAVGRIEHMVRYPVPQDNAIAGEDETREMLLANNRKRVMAIPIAAAEWRVGPTDATLRASEDNHLVLSTKGRDRLYSPLWLDFQRRRFRRKRTWRQLTVADQLRICRRDEAVGYRIQVGSEQWMLYRSLGERRARTVLGKHFITDFYCARFETGDGSMEDLLTVDDQEAT